MLFPDPGSQILTTGSRIYIGTNLKVTLLCSFLDGENGMDSVFPKCTNSFLSTTHRFRFSSARVSLV